MSEIPEDEFDMIDLLVILVKQKWLLLFGTLVPALLVASVSFFLPIQYSTSFSYPIEMSELELKLLEDRFYSKENIVAIGELLKQSNLTDHTVELEIAHMNNNLERFVSFEIFPPLLDSKVTTLEEFNERMTLRGNLLVMNVHNSRRENLLEATRVYRKNYEQILPFQAEKQNLINKIVTLKEEMAEIEENRYNSSLQLEKKRSILKQLKNSGSGILDAQSGELILQFDNPSGHSDYLPLGYQIQAIQSQLINLEEKITYTEQVYGYQADLLKLNETILERIEQDAGTNFPMKQFCDWLNSLIKQIPINQSSLQDYLKAYIKSIENNILRTVPITEQPRISSTSNFRGLVRSTVVVFLISLLVSICCAFLRDGYQRKQKSVRL